MANRDELIAYYSARDDHTLETREKITAKIRQASAESVRLDRPCVGKHWWYMDFDDRSQCPYCDWELTLG